MSLYLSSALVANEFVAEKCVPLLMALRSGHAEVVGSGGASSVPVDEGGIGDRVDADGASDEG